MWKETRIMKPKSNDKLDGMIVTECEEYLKEEGIYVYKEPPGGYKEPEPIMPDIIKVLYNNVNGRKET
jgi:hypothetical protein